jgi:hypothetical protein
MAALEQRVPLYFNIGRMNPPTPGHMRLIQIMVNRAVADGVHEVYVILSSNARYASENPLSCAFKQEVMNAMIAGYVDTKGVSVEVRCVPEGNYFVYSGLHILANEEPFAGRQLKLVMFVGDDRDEMAGKVSSALKSLVSRGANDTELVSIPRQDGMVKIYEAGMKPPSPQNMSSTLVKDFVMKTKGEPKEDRLAFFGQIYDQLDEATREDLFTHLDDRLASNQIQIDEATKIRLEEEKKELAKSLKEAKKASESKTPETKPKTKRKRKRKAKNQASDSQESLPAIEESPPEESEASVRPSKQKPKAKKQASASQSSQESQSSVPQSKRARGSKRYVRKRTRRRRRVR